MKCFLKWLNFISDIKLLNQITDRLELHHINYQNWSVSIYKPWRRLFHLDIVFPICRKNNQNQITPQIKSVILSACHSFPFDVPHTTDWITSFIESTQNVIWLYYKVLIALVRVLGNYKILLPNKQKVKRCHKTFGYSLRMHIQDAIPFNDIV